MMHARPESERCKARLVLDDAEKPIQLILTARQAADLAFIANDFARQVVPTNAEVECLTLYSSMIASKLTDLLTARAMMVGEPLPQVLDQAV